MCIVDRDFSCIPIASTGFAVLTCHAELCNKFLFYYMMSPDFDAYANNTDNAKGVAYYDWMRRSQLGMSMAYAFFPAQMLTILPFGWLFYTHGTLTVETFVTVIILALGAAVFAYTQGYGFPTQESVAKELLANPSGSDALFSKDVEDVDSLTGPIVTDSSAEVLGVDKSMSNSTVYVKATSDQGGEVQYKISMVRDLIGWKISNVELYFPSQN